MQSKSIWKEEIKLPCFRRLTEDVKTDVLIVGGGMAGLLCAYFLKERGVDYILVEKDTIASGVTGNTTAKITAQHGLIYHRLMKNMGEEKAAMYLDAQQKAVKKYFELCGRIDCDFEEKTNYVYSVADERKIEKEAEALKRIGAKAIFNDGKELPLVCAGAVGFAHQAQFQPLKFIAEIVKGLRVYEHTFVKEFSEHTACTQQAKITYQKLIFATHFPIDNKHGMYFMKLYQHRSYVIALENAAVLSGMYVDDDKKGMSFRNYGNYLLLGGGGHRTGKQGGAWKELREFAQNVYPAAAERAYWAAQDCMTLDGIPYIGRYSKRMSECFVATGFQKWGMSSSMAAAMMLADLAVEKRNDYAPLFSPSRSMLRPQLFVNLFETSINFFLPSRRRCPHLGCVLKWNDAEHSWDCPCHGSRFSGDGKLLDNPANGNLPYR